MAYTGADLNHATRGWVKERSAVNVKDYGAVGDGVTDDTEAIQSAISAVALLGGGVVDVGQGTFLISKITIPNNIYLRGTGVDVTNFISTTSAGISNMIQNSDQVNGNSNIRLSDFSLDAGRTAGATGGGGNIDMVYVSNFRMDNVISKNAYSHCFEVGHMQNGLITNCHGEFETSYEADDCFSVSDIDAVAGADRSKNITLINCTGTGFIAIGNATAFEVDDGPENVVFIGCRSIGTYSGFTVHVHVTSDVAPRNISFISCIAEDGRQGFSVYQRDCPEAIKNIKFIGCVAKNMLNWGYYADNISSPTLSLKDVSFVNCIAEDCVKGLYNRIAKLRVSNCDFNTCDRPYDTVYDIQQIGGSNRPDFPIGIVRYYSFTTDDYILVPDGSPFTVSNSFSIEMLIKTGADVTTEQILANNYVGASDKFELQVNLAQFFSSVHNGTARNASTTSTILANTEYHIVLTFNSSTNAATMYLDGVLQTGTTLAYHIGSDAGLHLGGGEGLRPFGGNIYRTRIANKVLSQAEVTKLYNGGVVEDLLLDLSNNENKLTATKWYDVSGNSRHGTVNGATLEEEHK